MTFMVSQLEARKINRKLRMAVVITLLSVGISGCTSDDNASEREQMCLDHAKRENTIYLEAIKTALPPKSQVLSVIESHGCDSANNGAWLYVGMSSKLKQNDVRSMFKKAGWSSNLAIQAAKKCGLSCEDFNLAKKIGRRIIGMKIEGLSSAGTLGRQEPELVIVVQAVDTCWDDNGYRCI